MKIFDSNIWVALFHEEDSQHLQAKKFVETLSTEVILPEYVLLEVCTVLEKRKDKKTAHRFLDFVLDNREVTLLSSSQSFFQGSLHLFCNDSPNGLSFVDISLLYLSQFHPVLTFDKKLAAAIKKASS